MLNTLTSKSARQLLHSNIPDANTLLQGSYVVRKLNFSLFGRNAPNRSEHTHIHTHTRAHLSPTAPTCPLAGTDGPSAGRRREAERGSLPTPRRDPSPAAACAGSTGRRAPPGPAAAAPAARAAPLPPARREGRTAPRG